MSAALEANALRSRSLEAPQRLEEHRASEQVHVVRDVEVPLVVGQHQVRLGDDADAGAGVVHHRQAGQLVVAQEPDHVLDRRVGPTVAGSASMISRISSAMRGAPTLAKGVRP